MRLKIKVSSANSIYQTLKKVTKQKDKYLDNVLCYKSDDSLIELDMHKLEPVYIGLLYEYGMKIKDEPEGNVILQAVSMFKNVVSNPSGLKVGNLNQLCSALTVYIKKHCQNRWVGSQNGDNLPIYYAITKIIYTPADARNNRPADVTMSYEWVSNDEIKRSSVSWITAQIQKRKIADILMDRGMYAVTKAHIDEYDVTTKRYLKVSTSIGEQFTAPDALGKYDGRYSSDRWLSLSEDGVPHRLVVDEEVVRTVPTAVTSSMFWALDENDEGDEGDEKDNFSQLKLPIHPYVRMFNLKKHTSVKIHVSVLKEYVYDETLVDKLILPVPIRNILDILVSSNSRLMTDIVKGKSGGIIVLATGDPGTGKTLTAETHAEMMKRPLYSVQCSQLGIDVKDVERQLETILTRSVKWNAILLIDEADVYIRSRDQDLQQNAIVGVFLRVLEYHSGTIFMTSNLGKSIDDAIISRCTAWIKYPRPTKEEQVKIWKVLRDQFNAKLSDTEIGKIMELFNWLVGRDIKTLLKLANMVATSKKETITVKTIELVSAFHSISSKEVKVA